MFSELGVRESKSLPLADPYMEGSQFLEAEGLGQTEQTLPSRLPPAPTGKQELWSSRPYVHLLLG